MTRVSLLACLVVAVFAAEANARPYLLPRNRQSRPVMNTARVVASVPVTAARAVVGVVAGENATAQGVANWMARTGTVGHCGGNKGYEGCGMASTKENAYRICCYANMGWRDADVGYAQGANGYWYCCRRYAN